MEPSYRPAKEMDPPPAWALKMYLALRPPGPLDREALQREATSSGMSRQFTHVAPKHHLLVRVASRDYIMIDPSVAVRAWAVTSYWAGVLAIHDALNQAGVEHAFACLAAAKYSDYVPDQPWVVLPHEGAERITQLDHFRFAYRKPTRERLEVLGLEMNLPVTNAHDTALLLASTGLPRERIAAKQVLQQRRPTKVLARKLNFVGLATLQGVVESEDPHVELPAFLRERGAKLGAELLRGGEA